MYLTNMISLSFRFSPLVALVDEEDDDDTVYVPKKWRGGRKLQRVVDEPHTRIALVKKARVAKICIPAKYVK